MYAKMRIYACKNYVLYARQTRAYCQFLCINVQKKKNHEIFYVLIFFIR